LAKTGVRHRELLEPERFDLSLPVDVVGEEVAVDPHLFGVNAELAAQEVAEVREKAGVRVRDLDTVAALRAFGPVEHAAGLVAGATLTCQPPPRGLVPRPRLACGCCRSLSGDERAESHAL